MQSTGQTSTQAVSFVPMHGSQMMYAMETVTRYKNATSDYQCTRPSGGVSIERHSADRPRAYSSPGDLKRTNVLSHGPGSAVTQYASRSPVQLFRHEALDGSRNRALHTA